VPEGNCSYLENSACSCLLRSAITVRTKWLVRLGDLVDATITFSLGGEGHIEPPFVAALSATHRDRNSSAVELRPRHERHASHLLARGTGHREGLTFGDRARHDAATLLDTETMKLIRAEVRYPVGGFHHRPLVAAMLTGVCQLEIVTLLRDCGDGPELPLV
jgi:hypothetical protein